MEDYEWWKSTTVTFDGKIYALIGEPCWEEGDNFIVPVEEFEILMRKPYWQDIKFPGLDYDNKDTVEIELTKKYYD